MPDAEASVPPVFMWDPRAGRLLAFGSGAAAAAHLRPWQEVGSVVAYDAEGRDIRFGVLVRRRRLLRLVPVSSEVVVVSAVEREPSHAEDLRAALMGSLASAEVERARLAALPLAELVRRASEAAGMVAFARTSGAAK